MKTKLIALLFFLFLFFYSQAQQNKSFSIFSYIVPEGFVLKESSSKIFYERTEGKNYCQLFLYPAVKGQSDIEKDFETNWIFFARNAAQGISNPETKEKDTANGWQVIFATAKGMYNKKQFTITLSTLTKNDITFYTAAVFSSQKYLQVVQDFMGSIEPHTEKLLHTSNNVQANLPTASNIIANNTNRITKSVTSFDDGWRATVTSDYVQVSKAGTEVRLHYTDAALDDARPNTIDAPEYYWSKYVTPYFTVSNPLKWSGVQYPVIYFIEGNAVEKKTGKSCYVAIKIVYSGGARPVVVIAPDQSNYQQLFPHPNDTDRMLNYNKFAVTANDITGKWKGNGGGGVEYYNAYSGTYAGMAAVSSTDEFVFNSDGSYNSSYRSASIDNSSAQFGEQNFKGIFSVTDWNITTTNRYAGKTIIYTAQLIAVKGGYLLYIADPENSSLHYTLYKIPNQ